MTRLNKTTKVSKTKIFSRFISTDFFMPGTPLAGSGLKCQPGTFFVGGYNG